MKNQFERKPIKLFLKVVVLSFTQFTLCLMVNPSWAGGVMGEDYLTDSILLMDPYWPQGEGLGYLDVGRGQRGRIWDLKELYTEAAENQFIEAILSDDAAEIDKLFKKRYMNGTLRENGDKMYRVAAAVGKMNIVEYFLDHGIDVDAGSPQIPDDPNYGVTALMFASGNGNTEMVEYLLKRGANINRKAAQGHTALTWAIDSNHHEIVVFLIQNGADINVKNAIGETPLHRAVGKDFSMVAEILIRAGARVDETMDSGATPLHMASAYCKLHSAKLLILYGADINQKMNNGKKPIDIVAQNWVSWSEHSIIAMKEMFTHYEEQPVTDLVKQWADNHMGKLDSFRKYSDSEKKMMFRIEEENASGVVGRMDNSVEENSKERERNNARSEQRQKSKNKTYSREVIKYKKD